MGNPLGMKGLKEKWLIEKTTVWGVFEFVPIFEDEKSPLWLFLSFIAL